MKPITLATASIFTMSCLLAQGRGLYFISGGDFRTPALEYTVETTDDNQTTNISPAFAYGANPTWTIKTEGVTYQGDNDPADYMYHTYPKAGTHLVKVYNEGGKRIRFDFQRTGDSYNILTLRNIRKLKVSGDT